MAFVPQTNETPDILASSRAFVDQYVTSTLSNPGGAILVVSGYANSRAQGPRYMQLHHQLSDMEIRDLFQHDNCLACIQMDGRPEYITLGGPYGYTTIEHYTNNPMQALIKARQIIIQSEQSDVVWFLRHDGATNTWSSSFAIEAFVVKDAMVISKWPIFIFGQ
jgi:hypothetical protein